MIKICKIYSLLFLILSLISLFSSMMFIIQDLVILIEYELMSLNSCMITFLILLSLDKINIYKICIIYFIYSCIYSEEYMGDKEDRFILLVVLFVFSMMLMILSPNLISILMGWDGLGLVSYCLVIYYQNLKSYNAGMITVMMNRIGDAALLLGIAWVLNYGSWNLILYENELLMKDFMFWVCGLIMLAGFTKSAQIPFSSWLPVAMAAPTPVSSLVHSSTLVTAGVYLLIRFNMIFSNSFMMFMLLISSMTMFMSGLGANFEFDLKKIIALSTLSQLGLMMSINFMGSSNLAFFHLLTHALFKALLFMCAGNFIHNLSNMQDIRFMGNLIYSMPLSCLLFNISNLSLCGFPFLSGFYSKDLIVEVLSLNYLNFYIYIIFYLSIGLTVMYSFRLIFYSFMGDKNFISLNNLSDTNNLMMKGMLGLIILVIFMGSLLSWMILSTPYFIMLSMIMKIMTLILMLVGGYIGLEMSKLNFYDFKFSSKFKKISWFLGMMWNMPSVSTLGMNYLTLLVSKNYYNKLDQGWMEKMGVKVYIFSMMNMSKFMNFMFLNSIKIFFLLMILFIWACMIF
uniref:NADH-ubiquinone oxidoreductase chain 5 n=1 Tax=Aderidae sp. GENSP01 TaxID=1205532 RepID=A0A0S2MP98_9CUCU|nr:NADH deshydrogenase subunit 5 [Aderidae sp. GENSP01]